MISSSSSFDIADVVILEPKIFFWVTTSISGDAALNLIWQVLLPSGVSVISINGKPFYINGQRMLPKKSPDAIIFKFRVFENFISVED